MIGSHYPSLILRPNHIFGMGEARVFKFDTQIDCDEY